MRHTISSFSRILIVLGMLIVFAGPLQADPVVTFFEGNLQEDPPPIPIMNINQQFFVGVIGIDGTLIRVFHNDTKFTFFDFHFLVNVPQTAPLVSLNGGLPFFSDFTADKSRIDFVKGGAGTGIEPDRLFTVHFVGFAPNTQIRATATVPEPTTLLLLGTGLAGAAIKARKKLKHRKSR